MRRAAVPDLRVFLEDLRRSGELVCVEVPVSGHLEVAEIHRRVIAAGGPALLFRNVEGASFPLVTNLFGTPGRAERAFGREPFQLIQRLVTTVEQLMPPSAARLWQARDLVPRLLRIGTRDCRSGAVMESVRRNVDLGQLPALTSWPGDGGPFITRFSKWWTAGYPIPPLL